MTRTARVENGALVAEQPLDLPEGTIVEFQPVEMPAGRHHPLTERFAGILSSSNLTEEDYYQHLAKKHS